MSYKQGHKEVIQWNSKFDDKKAMAMNAGMKGDEKHKDSKAKRCPKKSKQSSRVKRETFFGFLGWDTFVSAKLGDDETLKS